MNIFENLENLEVSEECFDEIIESITKMVAPILAGKDKHGREESIGTKIDRASHKHPYIMKASSAVDNAINKVRNIGQQKDNRTPEEKLKNVKPAGTIYGKDMYSKAQLKDAAYKMSESLYEEIMDMVETLVGKYKEEGKPATSYSAHHGRNISSTDIKDEMKGELYPKQASKYLDKALKNQEEHDKILHKGHDMDDIEPLKKMSELSRKRDEYKGTADMYMRKAYGTGNVTKEAENNYINKRQQIK